MTRSFTHATLKQLFARSCNRCAFPGCDLRLTDPNWSGVRAEVAHIRGLRPGSARYAVNMTDAERNHPDNLIVLCPNHHREIDKLRPFDYTADQLVEIKLDHEASCDANWATDAELEMYAALYDSSGASPGHADATARLVLQQGRGSSYLLMNTGSADATDITITPPAANHDSGVFRLRRTNIDRLSPGAATKIAVYVRASGAAEPPAITVSWHDPAGRRDAQLFLG